MSSGGPPAPPHLPLSPRSDPGGLLLGAGSGSSGSSSSHHKLLRGTSSSNHSTITTESASRWLLQHKQKSANKSYEERVNSLLLTREEDDESHADSSRRRLDFNPKQKTGGDHQLVDDDDKDHDDVQDLEGAPSAKTNDTNNFVTPSSTIVEESNNNNNNNKVEQVASLDLSSSSRASSSYDRDDEDEDRRRGRRGNDSSTHYTTPGDDDDRSSSGSEDDDDVSTDGSESSLSGTVETGRSFSPIYEHQKSGKAKPDATTTTNNNNNNEEPKKDPQPEQPAPTVAPQEPETSPLPPTKALPPTPLESRDSSNPNHKDNKEAMDAPELKSMEFKPDPEATKAPSLSPPPPPSLPALTHDKKQQQQEQHEQEEPQGPQERKPPPQASVPTTNKALVETPPKVQNEDDGPGRIVPTSPRSSRSPSTLSPSSPRSPRTARVPGGAAAKLMLLGPKPSEESSSEDDVGLSTKPSEDVDIPQQALDEIGVTLTKSKNEFAVGSEANRRYNPPTSPTGTGAPLEKNRVQSSRAAHLPQSTLFDRTEVFHQTATAAVVALLTPRPSTLSDVQSVTSGHPSAPSEIHSSMSMMSTSHQSVMSSAFQAPPADNGSATFESLSRRDVSLQLITQDTEKKLEQLKDTMRDPNKTLADLLTAIHTADDFEPDIGFTVRRKNACGALQVMTAQAERRIPIAWTVGVLPALTSVLRDTGEEGIHVSYPEKRHRVEFEAARNRAIACLMNLSMPPKNRIAIFHTPGLVQWLIAICDEGHGVSRKGACAILAYLGKTAENKLLMVQVPNLVDALERVLKVRAPRVERKKTDHSNKNRKRLDSDDSGEHKEGITSVNSSYSNESEATPRFSASHPPVEIEGYDETADEHLRVSRQNVFALLIHLVKEKDNAYHLARHDSLTTTLSTIANFQESSTHLLAVKVLAAMTRHRLNTKILVFKQRDVVPALVNATASTNDDARLFSCYALQNLAQDKSCRQELAVAQGLISAICDRCRKAKPEEERLAAISAIKNLCDEPANLIPMTNTPDCIATLMHLAHGMEEGITEIMQYRACDALATLSHWLRKIATSGQALENAKAKKPPPKTLFVPSLQVVDFNQWK